MQYSRKMTRNRANGLLIFAWCLGLVCALPPLFGWSTYVSTATDCVVFLRLKIPFRSDSTFVIPDNTSRNAARQSLSSQTLLVSRYRRETPPSLFHPAPAFVSKNRSSAASVFLLLSSWKTKQKKTRDVLNHDLSAAEQRANIVIIKLKVYLKRKRFMPALEITPRL